MSVRLEAAPQQAGPRPQRFRYTLPGAWVALVFACLAFTPSLLPRSALLQGIVCGITAAIGYGVGVAGAWTWRAFADRDPRPVRPGAWRVFAISAAVALAAAVILGLWWQAQLRDLMGASAPSLLQLPLLPLAAVGLFTGLVALSRSLRGLYHRAAGRLGRQPLHRVVGEDRDPIAPLEAEPQQRVGEPAGPLVPLPEGHGSARDRGRRSCPGRGGR